MEALAPLWTDFASSPAPHNHPTIALAKDMGREGEDFSRFHKLLLAKVWWLCMAMRMRDEGLDEGVWEGFVQFPGDRPSPGYVVVFEGVNLK